MVPWAKLHQSISLLTFYSSICKSALFFGRLQKKLIWTFYNFLDFKMWSKIWKMRQCWFHSRSAKASSLYMGSLYVLGWQKTYWKEFSHHQVLDKFSSALRKSHPKIDFKHLRDSRLSCCPLVTIFLFLDHFLKKMECVFSPSQTYQKTAWRLLTNVSVKLPNAHINY